MSFSFLCVVYFLFQHFFCKYDIVNDQKHCELYFDRKSKKKLNLYREYISSLVHDVVFCIVSKCILYVLMIIKNKTKHGLIAVNL